MFRDRTDAGQQLAKALTRFRSEHPIVLGLPRGGVVVAAEIARGLRYDFDVLLVKKIRSPDNPELALGAVCEQTAPWLNREIIQHAQLDLHYLDAEIKERLAEIAAQRRQYRKIKPFIPRTDRIVILVDDGLATGATMIAAAQAVNVAVPRKIVVAVPVAPPDTLTVLRRLPEVQEIECLQTPLWFSGVGQFYENFEQVEDDEVTDILRQFT